ERVTRTSNQLTDGIPFKRARIASPVNDRGLFQIFVKNWSSPKNITRAYQCEQHRAMSVAELKAMIESKEGIPVEAQRLEYGIRELKEDRTLGDYGIGKESSLHLSARLRGGNI
ncbi:hypothetical protein PENTCL1PPCAC_7482, partial [Pristionchus entomophagus]